MKRIFLVIAALLIATPASATIWYKGTRTASEAATQLREAVRAKGNIDVMVGVADINRRDLISTRVLGSANAARKFKARPFVAMRVNTAQLHRLLGDPDVHWVREMHGGGPLVNDSRTIVNADLYEASYGFTGDGKYVVVIDSGVDDQHSMLTGRVETAAAACFSTPQTGYYTSECPSGSSPEFSSTAGRPCTISGGATTCRHGTHVASIAVGEDSNHTGIAPGAKVIPIQVFRKMVGGSGSDVSEPDFVDALEYVLSLKQNNYPDIVSVNVSLKFYNDPLEQILNATPCDSQFPDFETVISDLRAAGVAVVAAAGNGGGDDELMSPACISSAIAVGSTDKSDRVAASSMFTDQVAMLAPGVDITAALWGGGYVTISGTSMAAPAVAGAFASLAEAYPSASLSVLESALKCSGKVIATDQVGDGRSDTYEHAAPRIDLLGAHLSLQDTGSDIIREWDLVAVSEIMDWRPYMGTWTWDSVNERYDGAAQTTSVGASASVRVDLCSPSMITTASMQMVSGTSGTSDKGYGGVIVNPSVNWNTNKISGYWLSYDNKSDGTIYVKQLTDVNKNNFTVSGTITTLYSIAANGTTRVINQDAFNTVKAEMTNTDIYFYLNDTLIYSFTPSGGVTSKSVVMAAKWNNDVSGNNLRVRKLTARYRDN